MLTQIILHAATEPLTHLETCYQGNTKIYRGIAIGNKPYTNQARLRRIEKPASQCSLYWITPYGWLNKFLERSMVTAWRKFKDKQPQHLAKRNWPIGTRYYFAKPVATGQYVAGQECIQYQTMPTTAMVLTHEKRSHLNNQHLWHCVELAQKPQA